MSKSLIQFLPIIAILLIFYAMVFIPEGRRKKKYSAMLNSLKVNDEVITRGGIIGKIFSMQDDSIIIQSGPDRLRIKISKEAVAGVMNKKDENAEKVTYKENKSENTSDDKPAK